MGGYLPFHLRNGLLEGNFLENVNIKKGGENRLDLTLIYEQMLLTYLKKGSYLP